MCGLRHVHVTDVELAMKALFFLTVCHIHAGGVSGALGKVVGVLAKTGAKLTMDEDFQEKRRRAGTGGVRHGFEGAARVSF